MPGTRTVNYTKEYELLASEVHEANLEAKKNEDCDCFFSNPRVVCVGESTDRHGNCEPVYLILSECANCGAKSLS